MGQETKKGKNNCYRWKRINREKYQEQKLQILNPPQFKQQIATDFLVNQARFWVEKPTRKLTTTLHLLLNFQIFSSLKYRTPQEHTSE